MRAMKFALALLSLASFGFISCERHKFEDVKVLHESHGSDHGHGETHGDDHGHAKPAHGEAAH
jgi:hypothetical protein